MQLQEQFIWNMDLVRHGGKVISSILNDMWIDDFSHVMADISHANLDVCIAISQSFLSSFLTVFLELRGQREIAVLGLVSMIGIDEVVEFVILVFLLFVKHVDWLNAILFLESVNQVDEIDDE